MHVQLTDCYLPRIYLQLRHELQEPLEGVLVPVDPEEIHFLNFKAATVLGRHPPVSTLRTLLVGHLVLVHNGLEDGGVRCDSCKGA